MPVTVKVKKLDIKINKAIAAERAGAARGIGKATEFLLGQAQAVTPHQTGILEDSGRASHSPGSLEGAVSFDTVYAVRQHEELTWRHDPGRQAKYLEEPYELSRPQMMDLIRAEIRRALR